jgi:hypothetical protein
MMSSGLLRLVHEMIDSAIEGLPNEAEKALLFNPLSLHPDLLIQIMVDSINLPDHSQIPILDGLILDRLHQYPLGLETEICEVDLAGLTECPAHQDLALKDDLRSKIRLVPRLLIDNHQLVLPQIGLHGTTRRDSLMHHPQLLLQGLRLLQLRLRRLASILID